MTLKNKHTNIIEIVGSGEGEYLMELAQTTLNKQLPKLTFQKALDYAIQITKGLQHVHG